MPFLLLFNPSASPIGGSGGTEVGLLIPPARWSGMMGYLPGYGVVLYGGKTTANFLNGILADTWQWNGFYWDLVGNNIQSPGPRFDAAMSFDGYKMTLIGGSDGHSILFDNWSWNGVSWTLNTPMTSFSAMSNEMSYLSTYAEAVLFGGRISTQQYSNSTFVWQPPYVFKSFTSTWTPPGRADFCMASSSSSVVLFGGLNYTGPLADTWIFNGLWWNQVFPAIPGLTSPSARSGASMVYDSAHSQWVLFGGKTTTGFNNETWTFNGTSWTQQMPSNSPSPRAGAMMAYDAAHGNTVLFGGYNYNTVYGDTWLWNGANWTYVM